MIDPGSPTRDAGNVIGQEFLDRFGVDFGGLDYDFSCSSTGTPPGTRRRLGR